MEVLPVDHRVWDEVCDLAALLALTAVVVATGNVIIAACARIHGLTILHYDSDHATIGAAADVAHEWVAEPGSL
jgi:predicted nucleic acid-binding protein